MSRGEILAAELVAAVPLEITICRASDRRLREVLPDPGRFPRARNPDHEGRRSHRSPIVRGAGNLTPPDRQQSVSLSLFRHGSPYVPASADAYRNGLNPPDLRLHYRSPELNLLRIGEHERTPPRETEKRRNSRNGSLFFTVRTPRANPGARDRDPRRRIVRGIGLRSGKSALPEPTLAAPGGPNRSPLPLRTPSPPRIEL